MTVKAHQFTPYLAAVIAGTGFAQAALLDLPFPGASFDVNQRITLPPIGPDRFYVIQFWTPDEKYPGKPDFTQVIELAAGVYEFPAGRYFAPGKKYSWMIARKSADESQAVVARSSQPGDLEIKPIHQGAAPIAIVEPTSTVRRQANGDYLVTWTRLPGAVSYQVATCVDELPRPPKEVTVQTCPKGKGGSIDFAARDMELLANGQLPFAYLTVPEGKRASFYVRAIDEKGGTIGYSPQQHVDASLPPFAGLKQKGFSLTGTLDPAADPAKNHATLGFSRGNDKDGHYRYYRSQFALQWQELPQPSAMGLLQKTASIEAILNSSGKKRGDDKIVLRMGLVDYLSEAARALAAGSSTEPPDGFGPGWGGRIAANVKHETSRSNPSAKRTEKAVFELRVNPLFGGLDGVWNNPMENHYTGRYLDGRSQIRITPTIGVDRGRAQVIGASEETGRNVLRFVGQLRVEMNWASLRIGSSNVVVFADRTWYHLPWQAEKSRAYLTSGIDLPLSSVAAVTVRYNFGRTAPLFIPSRSFDIGLGIKF